MIIVIEKGKLTAWMQVFYLETLNLLSLFQRPYVCDRLENIGQTEASVRVHVRQPFTASGVRRGSQL